MSKSVKKVVENIVYVLNPITKTCEEGDGIVRGIFRVSLIEWNKIGKIVKSKKLIHYEDDYSCGPHGCLITFNLEKIYDRCTILNEVDPNIFDVFEDDSLLDLLRDATS